MVYCLKDTLKAFNNFKNKQKSVWSNAFWCVTVCIFWKWIQYTIHWVKIQIKNTLFFLLQAPTHPSFTFDLQFLYEPKYKVQGFQQVLRTWGGRGGLESIHGGSIEWGKGGGLTHYWKIPISLQVCKFTKNELLHTYFSRILARL